MLPEIRSRIPNMKTEIGFKKIPFYFETKMHENLLH